jgi:hypothetical protein
MINYDTYYEKHCGRYYGWLPASKEYKCQSQKDSLKYFTLCAKEAIDVFMFEMEGVLLRDEYGRLPNVFICESEISVAQSILSLVRPPIKEALIVGRLERILTFQDDDQTRGRSPDEEERNRHIREKLYIKGLAQRLKSYFPFDIINFDPYGNLLNPDDRSNKLYQSFERIFELQKDINTFLLFVTTPIIDIHSEFKCRFRSDFDSNVSNYDKIRSALKSLTTNYDELEKNKQISIAIAKSIVNRIAKNKGWSSEHKGIYIYENINGTKMFTSVVQFTQITQENGLFAESLYVDDIVRVIEKMPKYDSYEDSLNNQEVKDHLDRIVQFREESRNQYR